MLVNTWDMVALGQCDITNKHNKLALLSQIVYMGRTDAACKSSTHTEWDEIHFGSVQFGSAVK